MQIQRIQELQMQQEQHHVNQRQHEELQKRQERQQPPHRQQQHQRAPGPSGTVSNGNGGQPGTPAVVDPVAEFKRREGVKRRLEWWHTKLAQNRQELEELDKQGPHLAATIAHGSTITPSDWAQSGAQKRLLELYNRRKDQLARIAVLEEVNRQQMRLLCLKKEEHASRLLEYMAVNDGHTTNGPLLKDFDTEEMRRARYNHLNKVPRAISVLLNIDNKIIQHLLQGKTVAYDRLPPWLSKDLVAIPVIDEKKPPADLEGYLRKVAEKDPQAPTVVVALFVLSSNSPPQAAMPEVPLSAVFKPAPTPSVPSPVPAPISVPAPASASVSTAPVSAAPVSAPSPVSSKPAPSPSLPTPQPQSTQPAPSATPPPAPRVPTPATVRSRSPAGTPGPGPAPESAKKTKKVKKQSSSLSMSSSSDPQVPAMAQHMVVQLSMAPIARCRKCNAPHPASGGCANLECEAGIRLALDALRSSDADPSQKQVMRKSLMAKLSELSGNKKL